jgi:hypothetical protein
MAVRFLVVLEQAMNHGALVFPAIVVIAAGITGWLFGEDVAIYVAGGFLAYLWWTIFWDAP